jgi:hypothetical protein
MTAPEGHDQTGYMILPNNNHIIDPNLTAVSSTACWDCDI